MKVRLLFLSLIGLALVWRVWEWREWRGEGLCLGCEVGWEQGVWQEVEEKWYGYRWKYRGEWVVCAVDGGLNGPHFAKASWGDSADEEIVSAESSGCSLLSAISIGNRLELRGVVEEWEVGGRVIGKVVQVEQVEQVDDGGFVSGLWAGLVEWVNGVRGEIVKLYQRYLNEPYAGLLAGIVLGVQSELDEEFYQDLVTTGTLHVVAASGYNITVVAGVIISALVVLVRRQRAAVLSLVGVWLYVLLAGASPAVVRAGFMGSLLFLGQALGREYEAKWGLGVSAAVMILIWPWMVVDVSFQLSVVAAAGILWGGEPIGRLLDGFSRIFFGLIGSNKKQIPSNTSTALSASKQDTSDMQQTFSQAAGVLSGDLSTTLAATFATLPIIMITFERVSLVSPVVNMLVLWLVPPMMGLGALMAGVGMVFEPLAGVVAWAVYPLLWVFVRVVQVFGSVPVASVEVVGGNWWVGVGWWVVVFGWWYVKRPESSSS